MMNYELIAYAFPKPPSVLEKAITSGDIDVVLSKGICEPKLEYGFYYFMHQSKAKTSILSEPRYKHKYHITNAFEHSVPDYDQDITKISEQYFSLKQNGIISRAFYKLWEIIMLFDLIPESGPIRTAHLAEAPGGFIQAVALYRQKFFKAADVNKDTYHTISLKPKGSKSIPNFKNTMLEKIKQITICDIEDCNIMRMSVQKKLAQETDNVHFITADGGFEWRDENYQEQEAYKLLLGEILSAVRLQGKGGSFVLKIFDTFTDVTVKIMSLLACFYDQVHIYKPLTSRPSNSEKYIVCTNFKGISKKEIDNLEKLIDNMIASDMNVVDIFTRMTVEGDIKLMNQAMCIQYGNEQFKSINTMMTYIHNGIFFGDEYHKFLEAQKKANEFWISTFYPLNTSNLKQIKIKLKGVLKEALGASAGRISMLKSKMVY